jgi:hypothetical protein
MIVDEITRQFQARIETVGKIKITRAAECIMYGSFGMRIAQPEDSCLIALIL